MDIKTKRDISLFKFSLIAAVVNNTFNQKSQMEFFRDVSKTKHTLPNGKEVRYAAMTIKKWFLVYKRDGIEGLEPKVRSDAGVSRNLSDETAERIFEIKAKFPHITGSLIYHKLLEEGVIKNRSSSLSTILRFIRDNDLKSSQLKTEEIKAFEMEFANDCWQGDSSSGPRIKVNGKSIKTYMISIIDDASRVITHIEIFENDNALNVQKVLKKAVTKYGVPKKCYLDNGGPYKNEQLKHICASIGTVLIHHPPYKPYKKGKIERSFRTIKDKWMNCIDWNDFNNIEELNTSLNKFISEHYLNSTHSALETTPRERYLKDYEQIKYIPKEHIDLHFFHKVNRRVNKDSTITINKIFYELPQKYIGHKINIKYDPFNLNVAYVIDANNKITDTIELLNKVDNSNMVRKAIDYTKSTQG